MSLYKGPLVSGTTDYDVLFGVSHTVTGFIVQSEDFTKTDINHIVYDQYGRVANVISYDDEKKVVFTMIGSGSLPATLKVSGNTFSYGGVTFHVDSIAEAGTFDGMRKWTVNATTWYNYPDATNHCWDTSDNPTASTDSCQP